MSQNQENPGLLAGLRKLASGHGSPAAVKAYTLGFVVLLAAFLGALVSGLHVALEPYRIANETASRQAVILRLLGLLRESESLSAAATAERFAAEVVAHAPSDATMIGTDGFKTQYAYYTPKSGGVTVVPIWGDGFWGLIVGYLAVDEESGTIKGIDFVRHEETPGLGGRIGEDGIRARFVGKNYRDKLDGVRIELVAEGTARGDPRKVDSITGATGTSKGVERLLTASLDLFLSLREKEGK